MEDMPEIEKWRRLEVWKKSHLLTVEIYKITDTNFPKHELYGLTSQIRRASVSVVANIVEGVKRKTLNDRRHFYSMSETSLEEVKYYIILAYHLQYITVNIAENLTKRAREIGAMLNGLMNVQ